MRSATTRPDRTWSATSTSRLRNRCLALPEAWEEPAWTGHRFLVRKRNFAHVFAVHDEGGDVRTLLAVRSPDEEREALLALVDRPGVQEEGGLG